MERYKQTINHLILGQYEQAVFDSTEEAGHVALASEGKYGWEMPPDPVADRIISQTRDKVVLEIGCGKGNIIAIPSLLFGAKEFYALDITTQDVDEDSDLVKKAKELGVHERLHAQLIPEQWWFSELSAGPTIKNLLLPEDQPILNLPQDGSVDMVVARHSIQFGTHESALRVLDLASAALKKGGIIVGINFTPFTGYLYRRDNGETTRTIYQFNRDFMKGERDKPGGYLHRQAGILKANLADLMGKKELDKDKDQKFTYIDTPTLYGILFRWAQTRKSRRLPVDMALIEEFYFSPSRIAAVNKLSEDPKLILKENHCFTLIKT